MIALTEAMQIAKDFIIEMNGQQENFQLEEIVLSGDKKAWEVTYSYDRTIENPNQLQIALGANKRRAYKRVVIDSETKEIIGMYNWAYEKREAA
jgi:hypothetical protein